jgi:hypothetical protein
LNIYKQKKTAKKAAHARNRTWIGGIRIRRATFTPRELLLMSAGCKVVENAASGEGWNGQKAKQKVKLTPGIEPGSAESESDVLPLHHASCSGDRA